MTQHWKSVSIADLDRAEAAFKTQEATAWLMTETAEQPTEAPTRVSFAHVQAYAMGRTGLTLDLARALKQDSCLRDGLNRLLSLQAGVMFTQQAAASSGEQQAWTTDKGSITLHKSKAQPDQVYVLIELAHKTDTLNRLIVTAPDGQIAETELTEPVSGMIRLIAQADDPVVQLLETVQCDVYLT